MCSAFRWRLGFLAIVLFGFTNLAQAYSRAYLVNNTGQTVYSLHVKLTQAAAANSAGSGQLDAIFANAKVSADGLTLDFSSPIDPAGIVADYTVWIGWTDANPNLTGEIASFYWGDADGNPVGGVQLPTPGDTGALPPNNGTANGATNNGTISGQNGGTGNPDPTGSTQDQNTGPTGPGDTNPGTTNPVNPTDPSTSGDPGTPGTPGTLQATPEPGTVALLVGGIALICGSLRRRRRPRS